MDLKRLEDMSDAIVQDFAATRKREEEMRSTNGKICHQHQHQFYIRVKSAFIALYDDIIHSSRINQQSSAIFQHFQYVLFAGFSHLAGTLPAKIFQSEETHRLDVKWRITFHH